MFFTSCNETSTNNNPIEIIPLNIGNKWLYSVKSLDDSVVKANQILKDTLLQGEKWFIMNLDGVPVFIAQNKPDGLWIFRKSTAYPDGKAVLFYKYPAKVGDSYDIDTIKISVLSIRDTIQVIGGTYTCYHYQTLYGQQEKYDEYLAPGIGAIKLLAYKFVSGQWQLVETTEFISAILK
jgi:hypothetical protein